MTPGRLAALAILIVLLAGAATALQDELPPGPPASGAAPAVSQANVTPVPGTFYFFYNRNCHECHRALDAVRNYTAAHPGAIVEYFDIFNSPENQALFQQFCDRSSVPMSPVPAMFVNGTSVVGAGEIEKYVNALAAGITPVVTPVPGPVTPVAAPAAGGVVRELTIPLVIGAALIDGINPCAFAVLIFLLVTLISLDSRRKILSVGFTYIAAVFLFYFLSGLGLFAAVQVAGAGRLLSLAGGLVAIIAGVLMIRDAVSEKPWFVIPESKRGIIDSYVRKSSVPAAFVLGILVGMFELPCTGGVYLAILSLLSGSMTLAAGIPYLLVYNLIFVLPLVVIVTGVYFGLSAEHVDRWRQEKRPIVRVAIGVLMLILGIIVLSTVF